jgi:dethiobiotin synthetase/adenosylmethionine--8-amino-7-oxononanoate aminotransferase
MPILTTTKSTTKLIPIFAANTDLGKTVVSAGLAQTLALNNSSLGNFGYIKPVQTGVKPDDDGGGDAGFVQQAVESVLIEKKYSKKKQIGGNLFRTLYRWPEPVSPHLAALLNKNSISIPTAKQLANHISTSAKNDFVEGSSILVETAGGVLSPSPDGTLQADVFRLLVEEQSNQLSHTHVSCIMVGDARLGGISTTLSSLEALLSRNLTINSIVFLTSKSTENLGVYEFIRDYVPKKYNNNIVAKNIWKLDNFPHDNPQIPLTEFLHRNRPVFEQVLKNIII